MFALREGPESPQRVEFIATPAPEVNLDKLARVGDLLNEMEAGTLSLADTSASLDAIDLVPPPWGRFASMLGYALVGLGLAPLLGGGWPDTLAEGELLLGAQQFIQMFVVALTITTGVFVGFTVVRPEPGL